MVRKQRKRMSVPLDERRAENTRIQSRYVVIRPYAAEHTSLYDKLVKKETVDGMYIGVPTTGIICRFGCPANSPLPENTLFSSNLSELMALGLRECKRCKPLSHGTPKELQGYYEQIESSAMPAKEPPANSPEKTWMMAHRNLDLLRYIQIKRVNELLRAEKDPSRPNTIFFQRIQTPLGTMLALYTDDKLCLLEFMDRRMLEAEICEVTRRLKASLKPLSKGKGKLLDDQLSEYFQGDRTEFTVPLVFIGTPFQKQVWDNLVRISYGITKSYKQQATAIGNPSATRAVANANGMNHISILVPCHRVIGEDGKLTGYGGGLPRKQYLLNLECANNNA